MISLAGEWDIYRREELQKRLARAREQRVAAIDLSGAKFVTSTLICELVLLYRDRAERGWDEPVPVVVKSAFVRRLLGVSGIEGLYAICDSVDAAARLVEGYNPVTPAGDPSPVASS